MRENAKSSGGIDQILNKNMEERIKINDIMMQKAIKTRTAG